jgi:Uma2 family endonuclease
MSTRELLAMIAKLKIPRKTRMTVRQYLALPPDKHCETELIYGEMVVMPKPRPRHNQLLHDLGELLKRWIRHMKLGMIFFDNDMILSERDELVYAPDLMFLSKENANRYRNELVFGPVDLCVEILSPANRANLQERKFADYEAYGIPWYWIIDPNAEQPTLRENQLVDGLYERRSDVVGAQWFEPGLFPGLVFRLPPLLEGDLKAAVKGKAKRLM